MKSLQAAIVTVFLLSAQPVFASSLSEPEALARLDDAGCSVKQKDGTVILTENLDAVRQIKMNGKLTALKAVRSLSDIDAKRLGQPVTAAYKADNLLIKLKGRVSFICPPADENCERIDYKMTMTLTDGSQQRIVKDLTASCGS